MKTRYLSRSSIWECPTSSRRGRVDLPTNKFS